MIAAWLLAIVLLVNEGSVETYVPAPSFEACRSLIPWGMAKVFDHYGDGFSGRPIEKLTIECRPDDRAD